MLEVGRAAPREELEQQLAGGRVAVASRRVDRERDDFRIPILERARQCGLSPAGGERPGEQPARRLTTNFGPGDPSPKGRCKRGVQRTYGLPQRARAPLVAMSARLVEQKGLDLILADDHLLEADAQFVFLGRGEPRYEKALVEFAGRAPDRVIVPLSFSERAEHRLLSGADILLMPSQFEPCGLTQMRAQRYGALPVARRVGGLRDTIRDDATGFLFDEYRADAFEAALSRAVTAYHHRTRWDGLVRQAMRLDHSWAPSAERYQQIYERAMARRRGEP